MQSNPLDQLRDIQIPEAVSWWPIAWPWWILLLAIMLGFGFFTYLIIKNKWRKQVIQHMDSFQYLDDVAYAQACNRLLKQVAMNKLDRSCANFHGVQWLTYLDKHVKTPIFLPTLEHFPKWLDEPNSQIDRANLEKACATWIRKVKC